MRKKIILLLFISFFCIGATVDISCTGTPVVNIPIIVDPTNVPLDQAKAVIVISQTVTGKDAAVSATLTTNGITPLVLKTEQSVSVNNQPLTGTSGTYTRTVLAAGEYLITVNEPTRGVEGTTLAPPPAFDFTGPTAGQTASLSGFTLTWSNPDPTFKVEIVLKQTLDGSEKTRGFSPLVDTGTQTFSAADLADFRTGKSVILNITLTKIREQTGINGFKNGTLTGRLTNTEAVTPGP
jgi:hypothetical protein